MRETIPGELTMYKKHIVFLIISFILFFLLSFHFNLSFHNGFSAVLTFAGIEFGFLISSLSTLFGKEFTRRLHLEEDKGTIIQQTKLQTLKKYYHYAMLLCLSTACLAVFAELFSSSQIINSLLISSLGINFLITYLLVKLLLIGLEQEADFDS